MSAPSKQHETGRKNDRLFAVNVKHTNSERSATPLRLPEQRLLRARGSLDKGQTSRSVGCDQAFFLWPPKHNEADSTMIVWSRFAVDVRRLQVMEDDQVR